jgi:phage gpG-like protein
MASFSARILVDEFTPFGEKLKAALAPPQKILESVGLKVVSITQLAFVDAMLRAAPWPPLKSGGPATLIKSGTLRQSIRVINIGDTSVTVGSDRVYAAVQQLGSREFQPGASVDIKSRRTIIARGGSTTIYARRQNIPPRPFFPIDAAGNMTETATERIGRIIEDSIQQTLAT